MENLTNEMTRLRCDIDLLRESRSAFLAGLRGEVRGNREHAIRMVNEFRSDRISRTGADREGRKAFAANLCAGVGDMLKDFREERTESASETRGALEACVSEVSRFVSDLKKDVQNTMAALHEDRVEMSRDTKENLEGFVSGLKADVENLLAEFKDDRASLSAETSAVLLDCVSSTRRFVSELKKDAQNTMAALIASRRQKTEADRRERESFIADLTQRVSALREHIQKVSKGFADDVSGARQAWTGVHRTQAPAEQNPATYTEETVQPGAGLEFEEAGLQPAFEDTEEESGSEERPAESFVPDELTLIPGVGPGRERMLKEAGIYTFAQIAGSTPEGLRKALGEMGRLAPVEDWIEAAKRLSEE
jgi:predicted flap endonuclease-1-like 5' DNA nuclease